MYYPKKPSDKKDIIEEQAQLKDMDSESTEDKKRILTFMNNLPATFLSEICWGTTMSEYHARNIMATLERDQLIKSLPVNPDRPIMELMQRVPDQSAIGQGGTMNFSKKRWFKVTDKGREWLRGA